MPRRIKNAIITDSDVGYSNIVCPTWETIGTLYFHQDAIGTCQTPHISATLMTNLLIDIPDFRMKKTTGSVNSIFTFGNPVARS